MKKKRKRSASSSSTSSSTSTDSSSSSSSSRRRSKKKKKKKKHKSSKRQRRISSKESKKSDEGKKNNQDEDEIEWYPAPPITSATFLNQKGGPGFGARDIFTEGKNQILKDRKISMSAASDDEEAVMRRTSRESARKDSGSPGYRRDRRDSDPRRRVSFEDKRRMCSSSADSEYSRRSSLQSEYSKYSRNNSSPRSSFESGRYEKDGESQKEKSSGSGSGSNARVDGNGKQQGPKKELPANLLDIFNQIDQFKKEKGVKK